MDFVLELAKLIKQTPKLCLPQQDCENSPYNSFLYRGKNCHLCFSSSFLEDCYYCDTTSSLKDCSDCTYTNKSELCYECIDSFGCYNCNYCRDCRNCTDCNFCYECQGCSNCFGCVGLKQKEFHIFNERFSKDAYFQKLTEVKQWPEERIRKKMEQLREKFPHPPWHVTGSENVSGDYVYNSKNCFMAYHAEKSQDCMYVYDEITDLTDCVDCTHIQDCAFCYNLMSAYKCYNVDCSWWAVGSSDCKYGFTILSCKNCFGCAYLQRKEFHILNKPYPKEEYFKRVAEIEADLRQKGLHGKYLMADAVELDKTL